MSGRLRAIALALLVSGVVFPVIALEPPLPAELAQYQRDGSLARRIAFAQLRRNHRIHPALFERHLNRLQGRGSTSTQSFPYPTGLPSQGSLRILALLVDFPDYPHSQEPTIFREKLFGDGSPAEFPYESLTRFYERSSYGKLRLQGDVLGWYRAQNTRNTYGAQDYSGVSRLVKEALSYFNPSVDFSQYDNNRDGIIDYFCIFWTGPDGGWGSLWWAWCDMEAELFRFDPFNVDGKRLGVFAWQWEKNEARQQYVFTPRVVIHETGHALGLPDYYDYDDKVGPKGGVGGLDMMDGAGDHGAFSKWLLDWVTPTVLSVAEGIHTLSLSASHSAPDCVALMPGLPSGPPFSELFLVQNRDPAGNDSQYTSLESYIGGLAIWHVDATLNPSGTNFVYDNSYTARKLLRLVQADGLEEIETGGQADGGDLYVQGRTFGPASSPNSNRYDGSPTGVVVEHISTVGPVMSADFTLGAGPVLRGDPNGDGRIGADDAILVSRHLAGEITLTGDALTAADADASGTVTSEDTDYILERVVGLR